MLSLVLGAEHPLLLVHVLVLGDVQHVLDAPAHQPPQQYQRLVEELGDHDELELLAQLLDVLAAQGVVEDVLVTHPQVLRLLVADVRSVDPASVVQRRLLKVERERVADVLLHDCVQGAAGGAAVVLEGGLELLEGLAEDGDVDRVCRQDGVVELAVVDAVVPQDVVVLAQGRRDELVVTDGFPHLGDVVAGQHEVELASEAVSLQDVGYGGAARLVNLSPPAAQWSGRVEHS